MSAITFKRMIEVECADTNGVPIRVGSVLKSIEDGERGVVILICQEGDKAPDVMCVGDVRIKTGAGTYRVTNRYDKWVHVPQCEQTYMEKYASWYATPFKSDWMPGDAPCSEDEECAVQGIMALLPDDIIDPEKGIWADRIDEALKLMAEHLTALKEDKEK